MKKILLGGAALLALLAIGVTAVGMGLPREHEATVSRHVSASPDQVWALMADVERYPVWRPEVEGVEVVEANTRPTAWRESGPWGTLTVRVEEWDPPRRWVGRIVDEGQGWGGTWTYAVEPEGDGSRVTLTERGYVDNPVFRFLARFVWGHDTTMNGYVDALERAGSPLRAGWRG